MRRNKPEKIAIKEREILLTILTLNNKQWLKIQRIHESGITPKGKTKCRVVSAEGRYGKWFLGHILMHNYFKVKLSKVQEFINWNYELLATDCDAFNRKLMDWLIWYDTERVHYAFQNKLSPVQYLISYQKSVSVNQASESRIGCGYTAS